MSENSILTKLDELTAYVKTTIGSQHITPINVITIMNNLLQIVEKYKDLTGSQKKMLVLDTIKKVINETVDDANDRMQLLAIVDLTMPHIIDTIVSAINGNIKFEKEKVVSWLHKIFCCESSMCSKKSPIQQLAKQPVKQIEAPVVDAPVVEAPVVEAPVKRNSRVTFADEENETVDITSVSESNSNITVIVNSEVVEAENKPEGLLPVTTEQIVD
jgi:hypothetical protein